MIEFIRIRLRVCSLSLSVLSEDTIAKYLDYFIDAFLLYKAQRFDVKGRKYIGSPLKYYFSDIGLRYARDKDYAVILIVEKPARREQGTKCLRMASRSKLIEFPAWFHHASKILFYTVFKTFKMREKRNNSKKNTL